MADLTTNLQKTRRICHPHDNNAYFAIVKKPLTFILTFSFFFSSIIMPYCNFDDTRVLKKIYNESREEDSDMDVTEFIFEKLLTIGELFEGDEPDEHPVHPHHPPGPMQVQIMQTGSLYCLKTIIVESPREPQSAKPTCLFRENKFSFDFHASIFHPPAFFV